MKNNRVRRPYLIVGAWLTGIAYTLIKGLPTNSWGVGVFDVDLISVLTGYLFLAVGGFQAAVFALGQGFLMDLFSVEPRGLSALAYMGVFWCIYLGSFYLNLQTTKGQAILVSSVVLVRWAVWGGALFFLYGALVLDRFLALKGAVSILGTGLLAPALFSLFDRCCGTSPEEGEEPAIERIKGPLTGRPVVVRRGQGSHFVKRGATRNIPGGMGPRP